MKGRLGRILFVSFACAVAFACACSSSYEEKDVFSSQPGFVMPEASGQGIAESEACSAVVNALNAAQSRLGCTLESGTLACPAYIRPAGAACLRYDRGTVDGCTALIASYKSCAEL